MNPIWTATMSDQLTPVANKLAATIDKLDARASSLFKESKGNFSKFRKDLEGIGHSTIDAALITNKYRTALVAARKDALGFTTQISKATPEMQKFANAWMQIGTAMAKAQIGGPPKLPRPGSSLGGGRGGSGGINASLLNASSAVTVAKGAFGIMEWVGDKALDVGRSLTDAVWHAATFRQNTLLGLSYMLKSEQKAREVFTFTQKMAIESPMKTEELVGTFKDFVTAHYDVEEAKVLTKAVADVRSLNLERPEVATHLASVFGQVLGAGRATRGHLRQLQAGGLSQSDIINSLAKMEIMAPHMRGLRKGASEMEVGAYVRKLISQGKVGSRTLVQASVNSLEERSGKQVGAYAKQKGTETLTGVASTFQSAFWDLMESDAADLANSAGMQSLMKFLLRLTDAISPFSEKFETTGNVILDSIKGITDALFGGLENITESDMKEFIDTLALGAKAFRDLIKDAWGLLSAMLHGQPGSFITSIKDALIDVGKLIGMGVWYGFKAATFGAIGGERYSSTMQGSSAKAWKNLALDAAATVVPSVAGMRGEQLKSTDTFDVGTARLPGGITIPKMAAGGLVTRPTLALIGEAGPEAIVPLDRGSTAMRAGGGGLGGVSLQINVNGMAGGSPAEIGNAVALCVRREITSLMSRSMMEG